MNIGFLNNINQVSYKGKTALMNNSSLENEQKECTKRLFNKVRSEVPQEGDFEPVVEYFEDLDDTYTMSVQISPTDEPENSNLRELKLAFEIPNSPNSLSCFLFEGTKQEILEYLGNEKNLDKMSKAYEFLKNKVDKMG